MMASKKILLLCGLFICFLIQVKGERHPTLHKREIIVEDNDSMNEGRGIISNIIGALRPNTNQQGANIPIPVFIPEQPLAPTFQVPSNIPGQIVTQRPSLLGGIMNIFNAAEQAERSDYNEVWLNYALQRCSRVDPKMLTAILPTTANGLRVPKLYFFQNETSGKLTWFQAQEWCTARGMNLLTVNDANENKVIVERLRKIMAGSTPLVDGLIPGTSSNPNAFWIGINGFTTSAGPSPPTWVGDGTSKYFDWYVGEPLLTNTAGTVNYCGTYDQSATVDNIRMDARECLIPAATPPKLRYICEVSDDCTALFMSRFPTSYFHHHNQGHGHIHYSPGGVLPPL